jgi:GT2 family glycosyltransferase
MTDDNGQNAAASADDGRIMVSVVVIFLDEAEFIEQAIESVIGQTFQRWEILLVDDGSTDASSEIARGWSARLPGKIRYLEHPGHENLGMSAARNLGLSEARGNYVAFLDADDVYLPDRLIRHVQILETMPNIDLVQSDQIYWYNWTDHKGRHYEEQCKRPPLYVGDGLFRPPGALLMLLDVPDDFSAPCSITVRRDVALELGGFEASFRSMYEDQVFLTKVYAQKSVYVLHGWFAKYRIHSKGSQMASSRTTHHRDGTFQTETRRLCEWQVAYLSQAAADNEMIRESLIRKRKCETDTLSVFARAFLAIIRHSVHDAVRQLLPVSAYRRVLQYRQRWSATRARQDYEVLCRRGSREGLEIRSALLLKRSSTALRDAE